MTSATDRLFPGKAFISTVLETLDTKTRMTGEMIQRYLQRAAMAGMIIALFYVANSTLVAVFAPLSLGETSLVGLGRAVGAAAFGWALVFIYYTKSELLTSNMMVVTIGVYYKRISWGRALRLLALCLLGNFVGGLIFALLLRFSTLTSNAVGEVMTHSVATKLAYITAGPSGWADLLVRANLCNFLINLGMLLIYNGYIKDDLTKSFAMIMAVFIFAFIGLEHSVANTVLFTVVGLRDGIDVTLALCNVLIALVGNFVGGGLLIGLYYAYVNDDQHYRLRHESTAKTAID